MENKKLEIICKALADKKGKDIKIIDVLEQTTVTDYFVIASGSSTAQVKALYENVCKELDKINIDPIRRDGISEGKWIAVDFGEIILHIFYDQTRHFYNLDKLWERDDNVKNYLGE